MKYIFIAGNHPALSSAELLAMGLTDLQPLSNEALLVESDLDTTEVAGLMSKLGGTIKIGLVLNEVNLNKTAKTEVSNLISENLYQLITTKVTPNSKLDFGVSFYGLDFVNPKDVGLEVKKLLKEERISSRYVPVVTGHALSSASVLKNKLIENGFEFLILKHDEQIILAKTIAIQPLEEFSRMDYGRPNRDTRAGMLPPKLARMIINLAGLKPDQAIFDPFCGSGTILTEAVRLGFKNIFASDKNPEAVAATRKNLEWTLSRENKTININLLATDARHIDSKFIPAKSIDAIITEVYLGPPRRGRETRGELQKKLHELSELYKFSLLELRKVLRSGGIVIMALPLYVYEKEKHGILLKDIIGNFFKVIAPLSHARLANFYRHSLTKQGGLVYGRPDQLVMREIVVLKAVQ